MGSFCSSCWGRRQKSLENEPLLSSRQPGDRQPPAKSQLDRLADVLAALRAGKLPAQDQLNEVMRIALQSDALDGRRAEMVLGNQALLTHGSIDESGRKVVEDVKQVIEAALQIGLEKNGEVYDAHIPPILHFKSLAVTH